MKHPVLLTGLLATATLLSACSGLREDLGLGRAPPDEFAVVDHPPLSMPPDFSLRPPQPGAPRPQDVDASQKASDALFGDKATPTASSPYAADASEMEKALLAAAETEKADPKIRETVDHETSQLVVANPHLVQSLLGWVRGTDEQKAGVAVDAAAESERIKQAKENNEPLNKGATPVIERGDKTGWLGL